MLQKKIRNYVEHLFSLADIRINGNRPWDVQIHDDRLFTRVLKGGSMALGESYTDGWWDCGALDQFFHRVFSARLNESVRPLSLASIKSILLNMQNRVRSLTVAREHYDLSVEMYMSFLDPYNQYTCGYFKGTEELNKAQEEKLDLICKKLQLTSKDSVLDIGCGWGGFAKFAAEHYGCSVTGISISDEQIKFASNLCHDLPVKIHKTDYRDMTGTFDKVVVCGMIEHVGYKNHRKLMEVAFNSLKEKGLFLLQTIGTDISARMTDPWINRYIFANGLIPSARQITGAAEGFFTIKDWHFLGPHYDKTLMAWYDNFTRNWERIKSSFDERFFRIWKYYLLSSAGSFRSGSNDLWQIVFSRNGQNLDYACVR